MDPNVVKERLERSLHDIHLREQMVEAAAIALARHTYYGSRVDDRPEGWPPNYNDSSKQSARNKARVMLAALSHV